MPGLDAARPILDALAQPVVVTDPDTTILYWNPAAADLYGFPACEPWGSPFIRSSDPRLENAVESAEALIRRGHAVDRSARRPFPLRKDTHCVGDAHTVRSQKLRAPVALIGTAVDVTVAAKDHRRLTEALALVEEKSGELRHQALHDFLTDLPNRALILDRTEQMLTRARRQQMPVTALVLDLDHFKDINDSLGRAAGDAAPKVCRHASQECATTF